MRNAWIICRKELGSYFVSPVAYLLLTMFGLIFGFFFWTALAYFVVEGMEMQMRGQTFPMNLNEDIIRPVSYTHLDVYKRQDGGRSKPAEHAVTRRDLPSTLPKVFKANYCWFTAPATITCTTRVRSCW